MRHSEERDNFCLCRENALEAERAFVAAAVEAAPPPPLAAALGRPRTSSHSWRQPPPVANAGDVAGVWRQHKRWAGGSKSARGAAAAPRRATTDLGASGAGWATARAARVAKLVSTRHKPQRMPQPHPLRERTNQIEQDGSSFVQPPAVPVMLLTVLPAHLWVSRFCSVFALSFLVLLILCFFCSMVLVQIGMTLSRMGASDRVFEWLTPSLDTDITHV